MKEELFRNKLHIESPTSISLGYTTWYNLDTKLVGRVKKMIEENEQLKQQTIIMEKYLELITDLALDYDGCNTIDGLKGLIDELDKLASLGRVCNLTEPIYENNGVSYNILHQELEGESE